MDKRLEAIKQFASCNKQTEPGILQTNLCIDDIEFLIQQAEEKQRLEEKLKYLESRGLQEINLGNVGVDANELVDEVRQALEESQ